MVLLKYLFLLSQTTVYNNIFLADLMELLNLSREFVGNDTVGNVNIVDDFRGLLHTAFDSVLKK